MKLLFIVPYPPSPLRRRPFELLRHLVDSGLDVTIATLGSVPDLERTLFEGRSNAARIIQWPTSLSRRVISMAAAAMNGEPLQSRYDWNPAFARHLDRQLAESAYDVIHVEHLRGAVYGRALRQRAPVVWDSVDCISDLFASAARSGTRRRHRLAARAELTRTRRFEAGLPSEFDQTVVAAESDRQSLLSLCSSSIEGAGVSPPVTVIANGVDLIRFAPPESAASRLAETILLSGKLSYHANVAAAHFLVDSIMPRVWRERPGARVILAGADPSPDVRALAQREPRVTVTGTVDDLRPFLIQATLAVAPLVYGVGIQNKVLEAMACATPVVITPSAAAGLQAVNGREMLVGEDADAVAARIIELLDSPARAAAIGTAGRSYVAREHSWSNAAEAFQYVYRQAIETRARGRS